MDGALAFKPDQNLLEQTSLNMILKVVNGRICFPINVKEEEENGKEEEEEKELVYYVEKKKVSKSGGQGSRKMLQFLKGP